MVPSLYSSICLSTLRYTYSIGDTIASYFVLWYMRSFTDAGTRTQTVLPFFIVTVIHGMREGHQRRGARTVTNGSAFCVVNHLFLNISTVFPVRGLLTHLCFRHHPSTQTGLTFWFKWQPALRHPLILHYQHETGVGAKKIGTCTNKVKKAHHAYLVLGCHIQPTSGSVTSVPPRIASVIQTRLYCGSRLVPVERLGKYMVRSDSQGVCGSDQDAGKRVSQ